MLRGYTTIYLIIRKISLIKLIRLLVVVLFWTKYVFPRHINSDFLELITYQIQRKRLSSCRLGRAVGFWLPFVLRAQSLHATRQRSRFSILKYFGILKCSSNTCLVHICFFNIRPHGAKSNNWIAEKCSAAKTKRVQPVKCEEISHCGPGLLAGLIHRTILTIKSLHMALVTWIIMGSSLLWKIEYTDMTPVSPA